MELRPRIVKFMTLFLGSCFLLLLLAAWGATGHRLINGDVVVHLPQSMQFFIQNINFLAEHASDADNRKGADGQKPYILKESPRHFIDIDSYSEFATKSVPEDFSAVIAEYDSANVFTFGIVPWAAVWTLDSLTAQLRRGDTADALQSAADLGHYVGDAHQPLHATKYYGGGTSSDRPGSGSGNVHSRYETSMIDDYQSQITIQPDSVQYVSNPIDFMFSIIYQSNSYVDSIYDADVYARQATGWNGSGEAPHAYYDSLWSKTKGFTKLQFQRATIRYADLLYTAWVDAHNTTSTGVSSWAASSLLPKDTWLGQNYPNPFNPSTTISFRLTGPAHVTLSVFTLQGRRITLLIDGTMSAGPHEAEFSTNSANLSSGVYFYRLQIQTGRSSTTLTKKMLLLK